MKKIILSVFYILLLIFCINSVEINYSSKALESILAIKKNNKKVEKAFNQTKYRIRSKIKKKVSYTNFKDSISSKFSKQFNDENNVVLIEDDKKNIKFIKKKELKGIPRVTNKQKYKDIAFNYLNENFPDVIDANEDLKILYVGEDYYANQEKDKNGEIKPEVNIKSRSFMVNFGRTIFDKPIFNSEAIIEVAAQTDEIISFNFTNWVSVNDITIEKLSNLKETKVKKKISNRFNKKEEKKETVNTTEETKEGKVINKSNNNSLFDLINIDKVKINQIVTGWIINDNYEAEPAFVHYSTVSLSDKKTGKKLKDEKWSFLEIVE